jgi:hypothetical protein
MCRPKILVLALAVPISLVSFSLAHINLVFAHTEQTEGFGAMLSGGEVPPVDTAATGVSSFTLQRVY